MLSKVNQSVVIVSPPGGASGTGFVYDDNGHIVTGLNVVATSQGGRTGNATVSFYDGNLYRAKVIGSDPFTNVAILSIQNLTKDKSRPLTLGNSTQLSIGDRVLTISNQFGVPNLLTEGVISGLHRVIPSLGLNQTYIISDISINPSSVGGPLLNAKGEVVGMNAGIFSTRGVYSGISFAIPSDTLAKVVTSLINRGLP